MLAVAHVIVGTNGDALLQTVNVCSKDEEMVSAVDEVGVRVANAQSDNRALLSGPQKRAALKQNGEAYRHSFYPPSSFPALLKKESSQQQVARTILVVTRFLDPKELSSSCLRRTFL